MVSTAIIGRTRRARALDVRTEQMPQNLQVVSSGRVRALAGKVQWIATLGSPDGLGLQNFVAAIIAWLHNLGARDFPTWNRLKILLSTSENDLLSLPIY